MAFINKISNLFLGVTEISAPTGVWETIIMAFHNGIPNYAWAIIVFTIVIKIALLPLDFFNKKITDKNTKVQAIIQPEVQKIQKQYGDNKQMVNQKTMELYKKHNYNVTGSCLFMLINMGITLFIFITLFGGLNSMAAYKVGYQYQEMEKVYVQASQETNYDDYLAQYKAVYDGEIASFITGEETIEDVTEEEKQAAHTAAKESAESLYGEEEGMLTRINADVLAKYNEVKDSWLWVSNVWKSDTPWTKSVASFDEFVSMAGITYKDTFAEGETGSFKVRLVANKESDKVSYEKVIAAVNGSDRENGYLIIPILAVATTVLSMLASQGKLKFKKKKEGVEEIKAPANPMGGWLMVVLLGGLMGYITISYNSVFALYIFVSSLFGLATTPLMNWGIKKLNKMQENKKSQKIDVSYKRK